MPSPLPRPNNPRLKSPSFWKQEIQSAYNRYQKTGASLDRQELTMVSKMAKRYTGQDIKPVAPKPIAPKPQAKGTSASKTDSRTSAWGNVPTTKPLAVRNNRTGRQGSRSGGM